MIRSRRASERGHVKQDWLDSQHTFSFGGYYDAQWMGYGSLRVINEDRVAPASGFSPHAHRNMEIISYVLDGGLAHRDSTGGGSVLRSGELQLMTAGSGIRHSEMNASSTEPVHFLQVWIAPDRNETQPGYQQAAMDMVAIRAGFTKVVAPQGEGAPFQILQDARLYVAWPSAGQHIEQALNPARVYYLHLARGTVSAGASTLHGGDALMLEEETRLELVAMEPSEVLLFEL